MGIVRALLTLPIKGPVNGGLWVARKVHDTAQAELNDPVSLRKSLVQLEQRLLAGDISEDDYDEAETTLLLRIKALQ